MMRKIDTVVAREAIEIVLGHVESISSSGETEVLRTRILDCLRETKTWGLSPPTDRQRNALMTDILALYVEVKKLERLKEAAQQGPRERIGGHE